MAMLIVAMSRNCFKYWSWDACLSSLKTDVAYPISHLLDVETGLSGTMERQHFDCAHTDLEKTDDAIRCCRHERLPPLDGESRIKVSEGRLLAHISDIVMIDGEVGNQSNGHAVLMVENGIP